jgi:hypothetical protein
VIKSTPPDVPYNASKIPEFRRDLRDVYKVALYLSLAERILVARSISMTEVCRGVRYIRLACEMMLQLGVHLYINHHLAMHYEMIFRRFGPVYAWWLFACERFNGIQEKVSLNGHAGGEMEMTLARDWVGKQRLYELVCQLPCTTALY